MLLSYIDTKLVFENKQINFGSIGYRALFRGNTMTDWDRLLDDIDFSATLYLDNKLQECHFFLSLLKSEPDRLKFSWLLGAFLNSCYGYLEDKAAYYHEAFFDPDTHEQIIDLNSVKTLKKYINISKKKIRGVEHIKTSGKSELTNTLYKLRNSSTHDGGIEVIKLGNNTPNNFYIGSRHSEKINAIPFCQDIIDFFEKLEKEL